MKLPLLEGVHADATMSPDGTYRYLLTRIRTWARPPVVWIMLNPSTADAETDDMTLRRVQSYSAAWGCGRIYVVNLFGLRASDPKALLAAADPIGPANDEVIDAVLSAPDRPTLVAAWGAWGARFPERVQTMLNLAARYDLRMQRLGKLTAAGQPRHPCRLGDGVPLEVHW